MRCRAIPSVSAAVAVLLIDRAPIVRIWMEEFFFTGGKNIEQGEPRYFILNPNAAFKIEILIEHV